MIFFSSSLVGRLPPKMGGACPLNAACIGNSAERASMYTLNILHASTDVNWMMRMSDEEESALKEKDGDAAEEVRGRCAAHVTGVAPQPPSLPLCSAPPVPRAV